MASAGYKDTRSARPATPLEALLAHPVSAPPVSASPARAVLVWSLAALAFGYAFFQRVAPSVMVEDLMREFHVSAAVLGQLSALYFYPYALLQPPLGALLDRFGARLMLTLAAALAAAGTLAFAVAADLWLAYVGRFLVGAGSAVGFIGSLALAARWFAPRRFATMAGLAMLIAMASGIAAQAPLAAVIDRLGWRTTMGYSGLFALALCLATVILVRNAPGDNRLVSPATSHSGGGAGILAALAHAVTRGEVWRIALVAMALTGPLLAFAGLWGVPYMMAAYGLERAPAAGLVSATLLGWAIGAPCLGWLSDAIGYRKRLMVAAAATNCVLIAVLVFLPGLPLAATVVLMFALGVAGAAMSVSFALVREVTPHAYHGAVTGLVNGMTVASGAVLQPVIGIVLDVVWDGAMAGGVRVYAAADYRTAFLSLLAWGLMGFVLALTLRETRCRSLAA
jgi:MFS family permease